MDGDNPTTTRTGPARTPAAEAALRARRAREAAALRANLRRRKQAIGEGAHDKTLDAPQEPDPCP